MAPTARRARRSSEHLGRAPQRSPRNSKDRHPLALPVYIGMTLRPQTPADPKTVAARVARERDKAARAAQRGPSRRARRIAAKREAAGA